MAAPFPYPPENISNTVGLLNYANTLVDGFLGTAIIIMIAVITFITAKVFSTDRAIGFSAFISLLTAILLRFMGMISDFILYLIVLYFIGSVLWLWYGRESESV